MLLFLALLTVLTHIQGTSVTSTSIADATLASIGCYCHMEGFSRPSYAAGSKPSFRLSKCLGNLDILEYDTGQARFSAVPTQLPGEHNLKCQSGPPKTPSPPPLEVISLIVSGPPTNRVNLMFFSDGCEFVHPLFFNFLTFRRQMLQMNVINSSKMQDV